MSNTDSTRFNQFLEAVAADPKQVEKLKTLKRGDAEAIRDFAAEAGFPMSHAELVAGAQQPDRALELGELSDAELEGVSGGSAYGFYLAVKFTVKSMLGLH